MEGFAEVRFPEEFSFGAQGGPRFFTTVVATAGGAEQRQINWENSRGQWVVTHKFKNASQLDTLIAFYRTRRGKAIGFRFRDWTDFSTDQGETLPLLGGAVDTLPAAGAITPQPMKRVSDGAMGVGDGVETVFQLAKTYVAQSHLGVYGVGGSPPQVTFNENTPAQDTLVRNAGSWITDGFVAGQKVFVRGTGTSNDRITTFYEIAAAPALTALTMFLIASNDVTDQANVPGLEIFSNADGLTDLIRDLTKPVIGAVRPFVNAVEQIIVTNFTVDSTTGRVTFTVAPPAGETVTADALFDVPVRFDSDDMPLTVEHFNTHDWSGIDLVEVRS